MALRALLPLLLLLALFQPALGRPPRDEARRHYDLAMAHYRGERFAEALAEFEAVQRLRPRPVLLFNIGQCHRRLGEAKAALEHFERYEAAERRMNRPLRRKLDSYIGEARAQLAAERALAAAQRQAPVAPPAAAAQPAATAPPVVLSAPAAPPIARAAPAPAATASAPGPLALVQTAPAAPRPIHRRWWFWSALGAVAAGVVIGAAVGTAAASATPNMDPDRYRRLEF